MVIEVDGPSHFLARPPHNPCGKTLLRNRLLVAAGLAGMAVPFFHWRQLPSLQQRATYLQRRLQAVLASRTTDQRQHPPHAPAGSPEQQQQPPKELAVPLLSDTAQEQQLAAAALRR